MTLLINASNLYVGGGVQVAVSIIQELARLDVDFLAAISPKVQEQLSTNELKYCFIINKTPSGILNFKVRRQLDQIVKDHSINKVFTVFGPSYWTPKKVKHAVGFALPWLIYDTRMIYSELKLNQKLKHNLLKIIQPLFYKKNADLIFTETDDVNVHVRKLLNFPIDKITTVSNTLNAKLTSIDECDYSVKERLPNKNNGDIYLLTISHDYPHKNLKIISELLEKLPSNYKFVLTLDKSFLNKIPEIYHSRVFCIGYVTLNQCPVLYDYCDALFLPTLLECFSASYLEAMYFKKIILTSDRSFAHIVCGDGAVYFEPHDAEDISNKIKNVFNDDNQKNIIIEKAAMQFDNFPTASGRVIQYLSEIERL